MNPFFWLHLMQLLLLPLLHAKKYMKKLVEILQGLNKEIKLTLLNVTVIRQVSK